MKSFFQEPIFYFWSPDLPQEKVDYIYKAYQLVEDTLKTDYLVGNTLTLADLSCITSLSSMNALFSIDDTKYPNLTAYIERMKQLPYYDECNTAQVAELAQVLETKLKKNRKE